MSKTSPFLIEGGRDCARGPAAKPETHAANEVFTKSRRVVRIRIPQRSLSRLRRASQTSSDFISSSQVTSRPVYAAVRAIMPERADSAPLSAWLWNLPLLMLSMNAFFFSGSADSRFDVKFPVTEKAAGGPCDCSASGACHGSSPQMPSGPLYGDSAVPLVPKNRSLTSHQPLANCVELNVTGTLLG